MELKKSKTVEKLSKYCSKNFEVINLHIHRNQEWTNVFESL